MKLYMKTTKKFGERMKNYRKRNGMPQDEAAAKLNLCQSQISKLESGRSKIFIPVQLLKQEFPGLKLEDT